MISNSLICNITKQVQFAKTPKRHTAVPSFFSVCKISITSVFNLFIFLFSDQVGSLQKLEKLSISCNSLISLPQTIGDLRNVSTFFFCLPKLFSRIQNFFSVTLQKLLFFKWTKYSSSHWSLWLILEFYIFIKSNCR